MESTICIVLKAKPFSETSLIINAISKEGVAISFIAKGIRKNRRQKWSAYLQPLALGRAVYYPAKRGELHILKEFDPSDLESLDVTDPMLWCFKQFAAEVVLRMSQQHPEQSESFTILSWSIDFLKKVDNSLEFPLHFLKNLLLLLGLQPDWKLLSESNSVNLHFVEAQGGLEAAQPKNSAELKAQMFLKNTEAEVVLTNGAERLQVLNFFLDHLNDHLPVFKNLKSISVIKEVFS